MPLQPYQIKLAYEGLCIIGDPHPLRHQLLTVSTQPAELIVSRPADVTVLEQRDRVVSHRPQHRILKVDHAQAAISETHDVAAVKIAVHHALQLLPENGDKQSQQLLPDC